MTSLPVEVLLGIYLGLLAGIVPALAAGSLGFVVRYFTGVTLPGFGVVVLALSIASVNGGLLGLVDPTIVQSPRLFVAVLVIIMLSLYAHNQGDKLGAELPRRISLSSLRKRTLSADVVELVGGIGQVTVRPTGEIRDMEGYPPLSPELRAVLREGSWKLPADLPLSELEVRLEERLRTEHELADVSATIDEQGRATIVAAPPSSGLSRRVPEGWRAVSLATLVPTGLARGDEVVVETGEYAASGTVLSARTEIDEEDPPAAKPTEPEDETATDGGEADETTPIVRASPVATAGGEGRVTVAVPRRDVRPLLTADRARIVVQSRGTSREFEALSLLRRDGKSVRKVSVGAVGTDDSLPTDGVTVLAIRRQVADANRKDWRFVPGSDAIEPGDEAFVVGERSALDRFVEAVAR